MYPLKHIVTERSLLFFSACFFVWTLCHISLASANVRCAVVQEPWPVSLVASTDMLNGILDQSRSSLYQPLVVNTEAYSGVFRFFINCVSDTGETLRATSLKRRGAIVSTLTLNQQTKWYMGTAMTWILFWPVAFVYQDIYTVAWMNAASEKGETDVTINMTPDRNQIVNTWNGLFYYTPYDAYNAITDLSPISRACSPAPTPEKSGDLIKAAKCKLVYGCETNKTLVQNNFIKYGKGVDQDDVIENLFTATSIGLQPPSRCGSKLNFGCAAASGVCNYPGVTYACVFVPDLASNRNALNNDACWRNGNPTDPRTWL